MGVKLIFYSFKMLSKRIIGRYGEYQAIKYLQSQGYKIYEKNAYHQWSEIDIIAKNAHIWVFIEVKTRISLIFGLPEESWTNCKAHRMLRGIYQYLERNKIRDIFWRVDFISVFIGKSATKVSHYKNVELFH